MQANNFAFPGCRRVFLQSASKDPFMAQEHSAFEQLLDVLSQIPDQEIDSAVAFVRHHRAGIDTDERFPDLADVVGRLDQNALSWLETVLCARSQQSGRHAAWRRFAQSSYRELL
jgi:hypothetical protein